MAAAQCLLDDPELRRTMGEAARIYAEENFAMDVVGARFLAAIGHP